jgi:hypothetical protein
MRYDPLWRENERKKINYLKKKAHDIYFKEYNQHLKVTPVCYFNRETDYSCDVCLSEEKGKFGRYLFEIQTYDCFKDMTYPGQEVRGYFRESPPLEKWIEKFDVEAAASATLYQNGIYTLPKFGCITKEDIENCTRHFFQKKLDLWFIMNVTAVISYQKKNEAGEWVDEEPTNENN